MIIFDSRKKIASNWADEKWVTQRDQSWVFFGRNDAEAETAVLWPPHAKS